MSPAAAHREPGPAVECAAVVLSGGLNTRMGGRNKAFLKLGGRTFLDRILAAVAPCGPERLLVTREPEHYAGLGLTVVTDVFALRSPLTGIHAGLQRIRAEAAFCTSCDTPLLRAEVVARLVGAMTAGVDVVVPAEGTFFQPLCAVYHRRCLPAIEALLRRGEPKADRLFPSVRVKAVPYAHLREVDRDLVSFLNVNTPADLEAAAALADAPRQPAIGPTGR
jgi:molybdopterin-guanine dinucleotide biosynthesis protein A